jgi:hypothetical protein
MDEGVMVAATWVVQSVHLEKQATYVALQPVAWYKEDPNNPEDVVDAEPMEPGASYTEVDGGMTLVCDDQDAFRPGEILRMTLQKVGYSPDE